MLKRRKKEVQNEMNQEVNQNNQVQSVRTPGKKKKKNKKKKGKRILIALIILLVLAVFVLPRFFTKEEVPQVTVAAARIGDVEESLDTSGILQSEKEKIYYAPVTETVSECSAVLGEKVEVEQELLRFGTAESEKQYTQAKLQQQASQYDYQEAIENGKENSADLRAANTAIKSLKSKISTKQAEIEQIQKDLLKKSVSESITKTTKLQTQLEKAQTKLGELQADLSEQKNVKQQAEAGVLSGNQKKQLETNQALSDLSEETAAETLEKAKTGISAEFSGIITDVQVAPGAVVTQGQPLFTIQSNEQVKVSISISKYELGKVKIGQTANITLAENTYTGTITNISKVGVVNDSGTPAIAVDVHMDKPDENVYLGVEAKVEVKIAEAKKVVIIPSEALNTGKNGEFCFVVENNVVVKKIVKSGVSSDEYVEITEGINKGDLVITDITTDLEAGITVMTKEAQE